METTLSKFRESPVALARCVAPKELSDLEKAGIIQLYMVAFELAWKTLKDYLEEQAVPAKFPREIIKESFAYELIADGDTWIDMLQKRNLMSHTYDEKNAALAHQLIVNNYFEELSHCKNSKETTMNQYGISDKSYQLIQTALSQFKEVEEVLLFGSRAKGNYRRGSDIDLALFGAQCTTATALQIKGLLNEELPIPYQVDVVCYHQLEHGELKEHINRVGKFFYGKADDSAPSTDDSKTNFKP